MHEHRALLLTTDLMQRNTQVLWFIAAVMARQGVLGPLHRRTAPYKWDCGEYQDLRGDSAPMDNEATTGETLPSPSEMEKKAIAGIIELANAESYYAIHHPDGWACSMAQLVEEDWPNQWPNPPQHGKLIDPSLMSRQGDYLYAVSCDGTKGPFSKLRIHADPLNGKLGLRHYCLEIRFSEIKFAEIDSLGPGTREYPIRWSTEGTGECFKRGVALKLSANSR